MYTKIITHIFISFSITINFTYIIVCDNYRRQPCYCQGIPPPSNKECDPEAFAESGQQGHEHQILQTRRQGRSYRSLHAFTHQAAWTYVAYWQNKSPISRSNAFSAIASGTNFQLPMTAGSPILSGAISLLAFRYSYNISRISG